jgi:hypothetical protein
MRSALVVGILAVVLGLIVCLRGYVALRIIIATAVLTALGVENGTLVWVVAAAAALIMVVVAIVTDLPAGILIVLTALAGAEIAVTGLLVLLQQVEVADLDRGYVPDGGVPAWAGIVAIALAVAGIVVQWRGVARDKRMRAAWSR